MHAAVHLQGILTRGTLLHAMSTNQNAATQQGPAGEFSLLEATHPYRYCCSTTRKSRLFLSSDSDRSIHSCCRVRTDSTHHSSDSCTQPSGSIDIVLRGSSHDPGEREHTIRIHPIQRNQRIVRYSAALNCSLPPTN